MLANELQAVSTVNESLKLYKGETIRKMLNETFGKKKIDFNLDCAKRDLTVFHNEPRIDFSSTHFDGVWGVIEVVEHVYHDTEKQNKIIINPLKLVKQINQIRAKNTMKLFFESDYGKGYDMNSKIDLRMLKKFDLFAIDEFEKDDDYANDDLPF